LNRCVVLCKLKFREVDGISYDHSTTITLGPFSGHETAGQFMTDFMDNDEKVRSCIGGLYGKKVENLIGWEVADLIPLDFLSNSCADHDKAIRSSRDSR